MPTREPDGLPPRAAVELANTIACPACHAVDRLAEADAARRWVSASLGEPIPRLAEADLARLRRLRSALVEVFEAVRGGGPPSAWSLVEVNRARGRHRSFAVLDWSGGRWQRVSRDDPPGGPTRRLALLAGAAIDLVGGPERRNLARCEGRECVHYLLRRTRSQRWCSSAGCGNRARVARHYRATRARAAPRPFQGKAGRPRGHAGAPNA